MTQPFLGPYPRLRRLFALITVLCATTAVASTSPYSVAALATESDIAIVAAALPSHIAAEDALVRATGARVLAVRGLTALLPALRKTVEVETDPTAAREQLRALALLGDQDDVALAVAAARKWPTGMDNAVAVAVARRGGFQAVELYLSMLRGTRMTNRAEFFRVALWGHTESISMTGARLLAGSDEPGWHGLLDALRHSTVAMHAPMMIAGLRSPSEDIRAASVWYLVRGYAVDPLTLPAILKEELLKPKTEASSDREDFGRELLRRMLGAVKQEDERWQRFLGSEDADRLLIGETAALQYLTDAEYAVRYARCEVQTQECAMPEKRTEKTIPSQAVAPPAFDLPSELPAGLADAIVKGARCNDEWIGVAAVSVDQAGRVRTVELDKVYTRASCKRAIDVLLRVSFATNTSIRSGFTGPVLLVHPANTSLCVDEDTPEVIETSTHRAGGAVQAPKEIKSPKPKFPARVVEEMGSGRNVIIIVEAVVTRSGCVRNLRIIEQSPYPVLNGAALMALAKWKFRPGYLDGRPVNVTFNLTMNFVVE